jgi:predicted transposase/invertase (TIGR01784 family)
VNIEVQLRNRGNMDKRSLFYCSREYVKGIKAGQDYRELPNVIAINIINFEFLPTERFHTCFHLRKMKNAGRPLSEIVEFTELPMETIEQTKQDDLFNKVAGQV